MSGDFEVDDLGALMAIMAGNAGRVEERRGALGPLNALGDRLLAAAHAARANTRAGAFAFYLFGFFFPLFSRREREEKSPDTHFFSPLPFP